MAERTIRLRFRLVITLINTSFRQRSSDTSILFDNKIIFPRPGPMQTSLQACGHLRRSR